MSDRKKYFLDKACFCKEIDDSLFILNSKTGQYHELNGSAKYIVQMLDSHSIDLNIILDNLNKSKYELNKDDVIEFIDKLIEREIINYIE